MLSLFSSDQTRFLLRAVVLNWILGWHLSLQQASCNKILTIIGRGELPLNQPGFENGDYYKRGSNCLWTFKSSPGFLLNITCSLSMPESEDCGEDRFMVHLTGTKETDVGKRFCGQQSVNLKSLNNRLSVGLVSMKWSKGGQFRCKVNAIPGLAKPLARPNCKCGQGQRRRIIDGVVTNSKKFPFYGFLWDVEKGIRCGASILNKRFAITAAHCFDRRAPINGYSLQIGENTPKVKILDWIIHALEKYIIHPKYNRKTIANDIALIRTKKKIIFTDNVQPICLPTPYTVTDFAQINVTALGYGATDNYYHYPKVMHETELMVTGRTYCQKMHSDKIRKSDICTIGDESKQGYKSICHGDSGGPLLWFDHVNTHRYYLLGVISRGSEYGCATFTPDIHARVTEYTKWILNKINDTKICI